MSEAYLAYAAGIIDGEGAIVISKQTSRGLHFILQIQVAMREPSGIPNWLCANFGGTLMHYTQHSKAWGASSPMIRWTICGRKAQEFIDSIRPYMIDKVAQADIALTFPISSNGHVEIDLQEAAFEAIRKVPGRKRSS